MKADEFVVGLDFGTTKICAVVGQITKDAQGDSFKVLGVGKASSSGIKKGVIVNIEATVEGIRKAVEEAELVAGVNIQKVVVGVGGSHVKGFNSTGVVGIKGREIEQEDIDRVIDAARAVVIPSDRSPLHILPQEYKVDDQDGIRDPMGMMGTRLEAKVHIVTVAQSAVQNLIRCCQKRHLHVAEMVLQPLASAKAVLSKDERDLGVALVDIGGGTTDVAIFHNGSLVHSCVLPIGGMHVSQDLAIGLRTPQFEAEQLKIGSGCALRTHADSKDTVEVPSVGGRPPRIVERRLLGEIIEPRVEEILQLVNREIIASGCADMLGAGVVLTGGSTLLTGMIELAEFVFDLPVKRAAPENISGFADVVSSPIYSTAVGLCLWAGENRVALSSMNASNTNKVGQVKERLKHWFSEVF